MSPHFFPARFDTVDWQWTSFGFIFCMVSVSKPPRLAEMTATGKPYDIPPSVVCTPGSAELNVATTYADSQIACCV